MICFKFKILFTRQMRRYHVISISHPCSLRSQPGYYRLGQARLTGWQRRVFTLVQLKFNFMLPCIVLIRYIMSSSSHHFQVHMAFRCPGQGSSQYQRHIRTHRMLQACMHMQQLYRCSRSGFRIQPIQHRSCRWTSSQQQSAQHVQPRPHVKCWMHA